MDKGTILIADDNPDILKLVEVNLKFEGYKTITADNGVSAFELARQFIPDLVILDVLMPGMDGWQVLKYLKEEPLTKSIPVVMLTGVSMKEGKERGLIEGVEDFLSKPFNPLRLIEMVEEMVSRTWRMREEKQSRTTPLNLGLVCQGETGKNMMMALSGSYSLRLSRIWYISGGENVKGIATQLNVKITDSMEEFLVGEDPPLLIIDTREEGGEALRKEALEKGIEVISGLPVEMIQRLLEEQQHSRSKEKSLIKELNTRVKELSILNDLSQIVTSPLDLWLLLDKISLLTTRVARIDACAILMYHDEKEKFVVSNVLGLTDTFRDTARLSLNDPLIEEVSAMRRSLVIGDLRGGGSSPLIKGAVLEQMNSLVAVPLFSKEKLMGLVVVFSRDRNKFTAEDVGLLSILAGQAGIAVENAYLYETAQQKQQLVEKLLSKLMQAQEEERKKMAADIHDSLAQSLVGILTKVQTCQALMKKAPQRVPDQLEELKNVVGDTVKEVRQIIFNLRPSSLDDLGLIPSLEYYIKRFEREQKIRVDFIVVNRDNRIPPSEETAIFRIIQEALNNVQKHSNASRAVIHLNLGHKNVSLMVSDNGKGFDWQDVTSRFLKGDSHGIQGMKERVYLLGGKFKVTTEKGQGCTVFAEIPLHREIKEEKVFFDASALSDSALPTEKGLKK